MLGTTSTVGAIWMIMVCFMPSDNITPVLWTGYNNYFDRESCEVVLKQIQEKMQPHKAACIYVPFSRDFAEIRDHIPRPEEHAPGGSPAVTVR